MGRLPPLSALRACEATARYLSVSRGAQELHVTSAAVSQQIRGLEDWLGVRLFTRSGGKLRLTAAGEIYMSRTGEAFRLLREATEQIAINSPRETVTIVAPVSFASKWLVPRIGRFTQAFPRLKLRIQALTQPIMFNQQLMDIGIAFGWDQEGELQRKPFLRYDIFPVAGVNAAADHPLATLEDLRHQVLIEDEGIRANDQIDWKTYFAAAGLPEDLQIPSVWLNSAASASEAAIMSHGVALARSILVEQDLQAGRLQKLFEPVLPGSLSYDLVYSDAAIENKKMVDVKDWLEHEAAQTQQWAKNFAPTLQAPKIALPPHIRKASRQARDQ